jgi:DNA-binding NtrC family response regulator
MVEGQIHLKKVTRQAVHDLERKIILSVLEANHWNRKRTASALKISYRALLYKIRRAGLPRKRGLQANPSGLLNSSVNGL